MNRTETEAAISGYLPRRARRHLPAIMAAVDAHATAEREDLDRVAAEGARRQKLVADEFQAVKAERDRLERERDRALAERDRLRAEAAELGKQVRVLVEERAAALAEANRLRESARLKATDKSWSELAAERDRTRERLTAERDRALSLLTIRTQERDAEAAANKDLAAERDRLREQLAAHEASQKAEAEMAVPSPGEIAPGRTQ